EADEHEHEQKDLSEVEEPDVLQTGCEERRRHEERERRVVVREHRRAVDEMRRKSRVQAESEERLGDVDVPVRIASGEEHLGGAMHDSDRINVIRLAEDERDTSE